MADIYKMRAKEVADAESKIEKELKQKYQERMINHNDLHHGN